MRERKRKWKSENMAKCENVSGAKGIRRVRPNFTCHRSNGGKLFESNKDGDRGESNKIICIRTKYNWRGTEATRFNEQLITL